MIDRERALELARARAAEKGWAFSEPVDVLHRRGWFGQHDRFEIHTGAGQRGAKARFVIDAQTGEILDEGYIPR